MNPKRRDGALTEDVPGTGEAVVLDPTRGRVVALNAIGAAVWELLDGSRSPDDLVRIVSEATGTDPDDIRPDVTALLARLADEGLLATSNLDQPGPALPQ